MELPRLQPLYGEYKDKGLSIVAVESKRDRERAEKFIKEKGITYTCLETGEGDQDIVKKVFGVGSFPTSFLVNEKGKIIYVHVGFSRGDEESLESEIVRLLAG